MEVPLAYTGWMHKLVNMQMPKPSQLLQGVHGLVVRSFVHTNQIRLLRLKLRKKSWLHSQYDFLMLGINPMELPIAPISGNNLISDD